MNLEVFKYEGRELRTEVINGEPWFVGKDVAEILGYSNTRKAIGDHVADEDKGVTNRDTLGGKQEITIINESGLYSLILSSKLEGAKKFKKWITSEVLPSIRKHGAYMTDATLEKVLTDPDLLIGLAVQLKEEKAQRLKLEGEIEIQQQLIGELTEKKEYLDNILASQDTMKISQIAADYGISGRELNKVLNAQGLIHKINDQWILYRKHMNKGYTKSNTFNVRENKTVCETVWTQKGRLKIHEILTGLGIQANIDKERLN